MSAAPTVRDAPLARIEALLRGVLRQDPGAGAAAEIALEPLLALRDLGALTAGALGDHPWEGVFLRVALERYSEYALDFRQISELLIGEDAAETIELQGSSEFVHLGAVSALGLAAIRIGAPRGFAEEYLRILFGLVAAVGELESVHRFSGPLAAEQRAASLLLRGLEIERASRRVLPANVRALLSDPTERARWRLLIRLFEELNSEIQSRDLQLPELDPEEPPATSFPDWMGFDEAIRIHGLGTGGRRPGETLLLFGARESWREGPHVVFSNPSALAAPRALTAPLSLEQSGRDQGVCVVIPEAAEPGWIGLCDPARVKITNQARVHLRMRWRALSALLFPDSPTPVEQIPDLDPEFSLPPWPLSLPFLGGRPRLETIRFLPEEAAPGQPIQVEWSTRGADWIEFAGQRHPPSGQATIHAPAVPGPWSLRFVPAAIDRAGRPIFGRHREYSVHVREARGCAGTVE